MYRKQMHEMKVKLNDVSLYLYLNLCVRVCVCVCIYVCVCSYRRVVYCRRRVKESYSCLSRHKTSKMRMKSTREFISKFICLKHQKVAAILLTLRRKLIVLNTMNMCLFTSKVLSLING